MNSVQATIITIGNELLIGQTIDTNSAYIGQALNRIGIWVRKRVSVGDNAIEIREALDQESARADILILTGGLGPTSDDITKPLLLDYFGGKLQTDADTLAHINYLFEKVYRKPGVSLQRNIQQANVPDSCTVLKNPFGTAPGMLFEKNGKLYFSLPGVPREMKDIMETAVLPYLEKNCKRSSIIHRTLLTAGIGESMLAESLQDFEKSLPPEMTLAYLPDMGMVRLRLTGMSDQEDQLKLLLDAQFEELKIITATYRVTDVDESMEQTLGKLLAAKNATVGTAESCTGGLIGHMISSVPGASAYYKGSIISYSNELKQSLLHVEAQTLEIYGAVSEETVQQMVKGALQQLNSTYALAVSGIMGPEGGTTEKPVGTVWIAVGNGSTIKTVSIKLAYDRLRNTRQTALIALNLLRQFILDGP